MGFFLIRPLLAALVMTGVAASAAAETRVYGSGPVQYVGQTRVLCAIFNAGSEPVRLTKRQIINYFGDKLPLADDGCNSPAGPILAPQRTCDFIANTGGPASCRVVVRGQGLKIRGKADARSDSQVLMWLPID